jgi:hypothetical protein
MKRIITLFSIVVCAVALNFSTAAADSTSTGDPTGPVDSCPSCHKK